MSVARAADATENGASGTFQFTRTGNLSQPLTVNLAVSGSATSGADYVALPAAVTFAANSATATLTVTPKSDNEFEDANDAIDPETVVVTVTSGVGYIPNRSAAVVSVTDDPPRVTASVSWSPDPETGELGEIVVTRSGGDLTQPLTAWVEVSGEWTLNGDPVTLMMAATIDFSANVLTKTLVVEINADAVADPTVPSIKIKDATRQPLRADQSAAIQATLVENDPLSGPNFRRLLRGLRGPLTYDEYRIIKRVAAGGDELRPLFNNQPDEYEVAVELAQKVLADTYYAIDWRTLPSASALQAALVGAPAAQSWSVTAEGWQKTEAKIDGFIAVDFASPIFAVRAAASTKLDNMIRSAVTRGDLGRAMLIARKLALEVDQQSDPQIIILLETPLARLGNEELAASYQQLKIELAFMKLFTLP